RGGGGGGGAWTVGGVGSWPESVPEVLPACLSVEHARNPAATPAGPMPLFADAEFALVGEVAPGARRPEGPFGDHYGYYSETHDYPWMRVKALCHRRGAIFPATVVGKPRQEDFFLGDYLQQLLAPLFPVVMP